MDKVNCLKRLYKRITGKEIEGTTICEVLNNMFKEPSKEIILASSTTDSTKKFAITVTDDGVIKATEIE